jgi:hypothetical protein
MLSNTFEQKQYGRIIKFLTGKFPPPLDPHDLLRPDGKHITDPIECLQTASAKFKRHYSRPRTTKAPYIMKTLTGPLPSHPVPYSEPTLRTS